jgi:hypothetical protein
MKIIEPALSSCFQAERFAEDGWNRLCHRHCRPCDEAANRVRLCSCHWRLSERGSSGAVGDIAMTRVVDSKFCRPDSRRNWQQGSPGVWAGHGDYGAGQAGFIFSHCSGAGWRAAALPCSTRGGSRLRPARSGLRRRAMGHAVLGRARPSANRPARRGRRS